MICSIHLYKLILYTFAEELEGRGYVLNNLLTNIQLNELIEQIWDFIFNPASSIGTDLNYMKFDKETANSVTAKKIAKFIKRNDDVKFHVFNIVNAYIKDKLNFEMIL